MKKILGRVEIKPQWDERVSWYKDLPETPSSLELDAYKKIKNYLIRNDSGSLIVSGVRGAGKTTTVISSVRSCENDDGAIFPIYLNSVHLEAYGTEDEESFRMLKILQLLIRSLANEVKKKTKIPSELEELIYDCEATKLSISQSYFSNDKTSARAKVGSSLGFSGLDSSVSIKAGMDTESSFGDSYKTHWEKTGLTVEDIVDRFSKVINILEKRGILNVEKINSRTIDLKIGGRKIKFIWYSKEENQRKKLVFILDELDVYDGDGEGKIKPQHVLNAIKKFKNLFTLSSAHFIFIVGKKTYLAAKVDPYRTLFSERIFLSAPDGDELSKYLDNIVIGSMSENIAKNWQEWKWYAISRSNHNLYDLVTIVNSYSHYDGEHLYIELPDQSPAEKALASLHYSLNSIFTYFRQNPILEHHNDDLFDELCKVKNNFKKYIFEGISELIVLPVSITGDSEINQILKDAKIALIRTLYSFIDRRAPDITTQQITLPWNEFRQALDFTKAQKVKSGAVTSIEQNLMATHDSFLAAINMKFGQYLGFEVNSDNLSTSLQTLSELLFTNFNEEDVSIVQSAVSQIQTLRVDQRDWELITRAGQSLTALSFIQSKFELLGKHLIAKTDYGQISIENSRITLNTDTSHGFNLYSRMTFFLPKIEENGFFELRARVKLPSHAITNFLFYKKWAPDEPKSEFYMVRMDSRNPEDTYGDSILYKPLDSAWDIVPDSAIKKIGTNANEEVEIKIVIRKGFLEFSKKKGRKFKLIAKTKIDGTQLLGIANELNTTEVTIQSMQIGTTYYRIK